MLALHPLRVVSSATTRFPCHFEREHSSSAPSPCRFEPDGLLRARPLIFRPRCHFEPQRLLSNPRLIFSSSTTRLPHQPCFYEPECSFTSLTPSFQAQGTCPLPPMCSIEHRRSPCLTLPCSLKCRCLLLPRRVFRMPLLDSSSLAFTLYK